MRELDISIGIISRSGEYLLQRRVSDPQIGAAGKIGAFGGKIETGETAKQALCREISEETSLTLTYSQVRHIASYVIMSDHQLEDVSVNVEAFEVDVDEEVTAKEGEVVGVPHGKVAEVLDLMTPATRYYFETVRGE